MIYKQFTLKNVLNIKYNSNFKQKHMLPCADNDKKSNKLKFSKLIIIKFVPG